MSASPLVSVNMAAYNAGKFIAEAIESVLSQTYQNWELIIIDDCSTDNTSEEVNRFNDQRIKIFKNEQNEGIVYTRNRALHYSQGKYVSVLDADDVYLPEKLAEQINFLDNHPDYGMVGSAYRLIDDKSKPIGNITCWYAKAEYSPAILLFNNFFVHSSVVFRTKLAKDILYKPLVKGYSPSEEYQLYVEIARNHKIYNLNKELTYYREHNTGISKLRNDKINEHIDIIILNQLSRLQIFPDAEELKLHKSFSFAFDRLELKHILAVRSWIEKLIKQNRKLKVYDNYFEEYFAFRWFEIARFNANFGLKMFIIFQSSSLSFHPLISFEKRKFLFLRCLYEFKKNYSEHA